MGETSYVVSIVRSHCKIKQVGFILGDGRAHVTPFLDAFISVQLCRAPEQATLDTLVTIVAEPNFAHCFVFNDSDWAADKKAAWKYLRV